MNQSQPDESGTVSQERRATPRRDVDRENLDAYQHYRLKTENLEKLVETTAFMNSTIVLEDLLSRIMSASKRVVNADASSLYLVDDAKGELTPLIIEGGAGGELKALPNLKMGYGIAGWVAQRGQPELIEDAYRHPKFDPDYDRKTGYQTKSMICVPIQSSDKILGVSQVINKLDGSSFTRDDLELFEAFCAQAAIAIVNAQMHQALLERQRLEQDLQFAKTIQQSFLPQHPPDTSGYAFATAYTAAQQVGGDFYDFIEFPDNRIGVVLGDVSGKGVSAALYMAKLMSDFQVIALSEHIPTRVISRINNLLVERSRRGMFVTLLYLLIELKEDLLTVINAGHLPPLLRNGTTGAVTTMDEISGSPLGILPDMTFRAICHRFEPGDAILLYTDGVMEARNAKKQEFGLERLQQILAGSSDPVGVLDDVQHALLEFMGSQNQHDDITLLCLGVRT